MKKPTYPAIKTIFGLLASCAPIIVKNFLLSPAAIDAARELNANIPVQDLVFQGILSYSLWIATIWFTIDSALQLKKHYELRR